MIGMSIRGSRFASCQSERYADQARDVDSDPHMCLGAAVPVGGAPRLGLGGNNGNDEARLGYRRARKSDS